VSEQRSSETERATEEVEKGAKNDRSQTPDERTGRKESEEE
jgi:hypothetical protein